MSGLFKQRLQLFGTHKLVEMLKLGLHLLELVIRQLLNFDFDLEAHAILVFDVLRRAKAFELPVDHDADLCAQSLCFLHRMSRQNYRALFPQR